MPKEKSNKNFLLKMVREYKGALKIEEDWLFCNICSCKVNSLKKANVEQHFSTNKHKIAAAKQENQPQKLITEFSVPTSTEIFHQDLCKTLIASNIPMKKISCPIFKNFLEKYTNFATPCETSLRNKYIPQLHQETLEKMREIVKDKYIWISVDETTDSEQRYVANFLFGVLDDSNENKSYLLNMGVLASANGASIAAFCNDSLQILWPDGK